jgi:alkyl sulfatase BDS1-like metallo-beta-lactamase superfamily hydrolase
VRCDICWNDRPRAALAVGPAVISTRVGKALDGTDWALCASCVEALKSGDYTTVRMLVRLNVSAVDDSEQLKEAQADLGEELLRALAEEYRWGAPLTPLP